jgi:hypothetical protein
MRLGLILLTIEIGGVQGRWPAGTTMIEALMKLSFLWSAISGLFMMRGYHRLRRLGLKGSHLARLLSGPCPSDPEESFFWRWTLQVCFAVLAIVVSVFLLVFTS